MLIVCALHSSLDRIITYGLNQLIRQAYRPDEVRDVITKTISYMKRISADEKYKDIINECKNKDTQCAEWALDDGCDDNPRYMKAECAPACQSCDYVSEMKEMCGISPDSSLDAIKPGGMNELFENMVHSADKLGFEPKVWSRPLKTYGSAASNESDTIAPTCENDLTNPCGVEDGPWVITLENFVSDEEISVLLTWGKAMKYERSQAGGKPLLFSTRIPVGIRMELTLAPHLFVFKLIRRNNTSSYIRSLMVHR